jgi:glycosyltransferase involved in cell wall biosynthesis
MKVLQINNSEAVVGGSERVYHLTSELLAKRGHEVCSLSCGDAAVGDYKRAYLLPRNAYFGDTPLDALRNAAAFVHRREAATVLDELIQREHPDVAHLHIFYGQLSSAVLPVLKRNHVPTVMSVHEYRMLCPVATMYRDGHGVCEECAGGHYWHAVQHRCNRASRTASALSASESYWRDAVYPYAKYVDHFIMVSEFCRRKHLQHIPELESKSSTLHNFVDAKAAAKFEAPESPGYFLYAGRLSIEKGLDLLLSVVAARPDLKLLVAGTGPLRDTLVRQYSRFANIVFLGHLSRDGLLRVMREARACVVPSVWYENNPMSILESFAAGTPVIGADIGGIPELISDGETGFLFRAGDADSLANSLSRAAAAGTQELGAMKRRCHELAVERHGPNAYLDALLATYAKVLGAGPIDPTA